MVGKTATSGGQSKRKKPRIKKRNEEDALSNQAVHIYIYTCTYIYIYVYYYIYICIYMSMFICMSMYVIQQSSTIPDPMNANPHKP